MAERWIARPRPSPRAQVRLLCIPFAGGGAGVYRGWAALLPPEIELCLAQLPGREQRFAEPLQDRAVPLLDALGRELAALGDLPLAIFGHSMGGLLAFELGRRLERAVDLQLLAVFVSGRAAPHLRDRELLHILPDAALIEALARLGGIPPEVLAHQELMKIVVPILRADLAVDETAELARAPLLRAPLIALGGRRDPLVTPASVEAWREYARGEFRAAFCDGDHFFLQGDRGFVLGEVTGELRARLLADDGGVP
jgi:medium-chain acyl-[acyl-carrier-protein] hydrolase